MSLSGVAQVIRCQHTMTQEPTQPTDRRQAAVFGGSISGLMSALVLARQGFEVVLYEQRERYSRNIQWGIRQSFINYVAGIDQSTADDLTKGVVSSIRYGHRFLADKSFLYEHGAYQHQQRASPSAGAPAVHDLSGMRTLDEEIVGLVPAIVLEQFLFGKVNRLEHVTIYHKKAPDIELDPRDSCYYVLDDDGRRIRYDLIVVCEGAASTTRAKTDIVSINVSRPVRQVSGEVYLKRHGMITEYLHAVHHVDRVREELLLSLLISTERRRSSWIVGDVSSECLSALGRAATEPEKKEVIEAEFRTIAARTMLDTIENVRDAGYRGAVRSVELFTLQARISTKAVAGGNLVLAGDAVGVGHWAVGGGMHVAAVCHGQRLEALASSLQRAPVDGQAAFRSYSDGVLTDTLAWISRSIKYYYLSILGDVTKAVFDKLILIQELMAGNSIDVPEELKARVTAVYFG